MEIEDVNAATINNKKNNAPIIAPPGIELKISGKVLPYLYVGHYSLVFKAGEIVPKIVKTAENFVISHFQSKKNHQSQPQLFVNI